MKKIRSKKKLGLAKDTLRSLQSRELAKAQAGLMKETRQSACPFACE